MSLTLNIEKADDELSQEFSKAIIEMKDMEKSRRTYFFYPVNDEHIEKYAQIWRELGYYTEIHKDYLDISAWSRGIHCRVSMSIPHSLDANISSTKDFFPEIYHKQILTQNEMCIFKQQNISEDMDKLFEIIFREITNNNINHVSYDKEFSVEMRNMNLREKELCYIEGIVVTVKGNYFLCKSLMGILEMLLTERDMSDVRFYLSKFKTKLHLLKVICYDFSDGTVTFKLSRT